MLLTLHVEIDAGGMLMFCPDEPTEAAAFALWESLSRDQKVVAGRAVRDEVKARGGLHTGRPISFYTLVEV